MCGGSGGLVRGLITAAAIATESIILAHESRVKQREKAERRSRERKQRAEAESEATRVRA